MSIFLTQMTYAANKVENIAMTENADCQGGKGIRFDVNGVYIDGMKGKQMHFGMNISQNGQWLNDEWVGLTPQTVGFDPAYWKNAGWFCYKYDALKKKGDPNTAFWASFFAVDTAAQKTLVQKDVSFKIPSDQPQTVSEGKATGTVAVTTTADPVEVLVNLSYKGPNRRVDGYLSMARLQKPHNLICVFSVNGPSWINLEHFKKFFEQFKGMVGIPLEIYRTGS